MGVQADDTESIIESNKQAVKKERIRHNSRTPDASKNNKGIYPLRSVQEYIGGHRVVFDSTPGARVVETAHGSGTFQQWAEDGGEIKVVVGNAHHHMKEGYTLTVNQQGDIKIDGHCRVSVGGGVHLEVRGDVSVVTTGTITHYTSRNYNIVAGGKVNIVGRAGVSISSDNSIKVRAEKDHIMKIGQNAIAEIGEYSLTQVQGPHDTYAKGSIEIASDANMMLKAKSRIDLN